MTVVKEIKGESVIMGRLDCGTDLLEGFLKICNRYKIRLGKIEAIGAVNKARIGYFDQNDGEYRFQSIDKQLEITSLNGNISLKDKESFVHAHINLADLSGQVFGGHLAPGTEVFACEFIVHRYEGPELSRKFDQETGLNLWE